MTPKHAECIYSKEKRLSPYQHQTLPKEAFHYDVLYPVAIEKLDRFWDYNLFQAIKHVLK